MPPRAKRTVTFICDTREPASVKLAVSDLGGIHPEYVALPEADFLLVDSDACMMGIERKTYLDFLASLQDGRLVSQLTRMRESYPHQGLILEGSYEVDGEGYITCSIGTRWTHAALQMTIFSIQQNFPSLCIWQTLGLGTTVDVLRAFAARGVTKGCFFASSLFPGVPDVRQPDRRPAHRQRARPDRDVRQHPARRSSGPAVLLELP